MNDKAVHEQLESLEMVLEEAGRQGILTQVVWDAFRLQREKHYDLLKSFDQSLWDWTLIEAKREKKCCPHKLLEALNNVERYYK